MLETESLLDQLLVEADVVLTRVESVDEEAELIEKKVKLLEIRSKETTRTILQNARRVSMVLRRFAMASGSAFNEVITLGIEAALLTAELIQQLGFIDLNLQSLKDIDTFKNEY